MSRAAEPAIKKAGGEDGPMSRIVSTDRAGQARVEGWAAAGVGRARTVMHRRGLGWVLHFKKCRTVQEKMTAAVRMVRGQTARQTWIGEGTRGDGIASDLCEWLATCMHCHCSELVRVCAKVEWV